MRLFVNFYAPFTLFFSLQGWTASVSGAVPAFPGHLPPVPGLGLGSTTAPGTSPAEAQPPKVHFAGPAGLSCDSAEQLVRARMGVSIGAESCAELLCYSGAVLCLTMSRRSFANC